MERQACRTMGWVVLCMASWTVAGQRSIEDAVLPAGAQRIWDTAKAYKEATSTRERICVNGLWRWQPAEADSTQVPQGNWGYSKVPGAWPGITDYMQKDSQTVHAHPSWSDRRRSSITAAWYERQIAVPASWAGRRISLCLEYLNSYAAVYIDGERVGETRFPAGEVDLTAWCRPGQTHRLSLLVVAMPLQGVMLADKTPSEQACGRLANKLSLIWHAEFLSSRVLRLETSFA